MDVQRATTVHGYPAPYKRGSSELCVRRNDIGPLVKALAFGPGAGKVSRGASATARREPLLIGSSRESAFARLEKRALARARVSPLG